MNEVCSCPVSCPATIPVRCSSFHSRKTRSDSRWTSGQGLRLGQDQKWPRLSLKKQSKLLFFLREWTLKLVQTNTHKQVGWLDFLKSPSIFCCCLNVGGKASPDLMGATDDMTHSCWWLGVARCLGFPVFVEILEYRWMSSSLFPLSSSKLK